MLPKNRQPPEDDDMSDGLNYVYFDDGLNDYGDEYDRYEDYYLETGNDPYGMFDEQKDRSFLIPLVKRKLARVSRLKTRLLDWLHKRPSADVDDIPW